MVSIYAQESKTLEKNKGNEELLLMEWKLLRDCVELKFKYCKEYREKLKECKGKKIVESPSQAGGMQLSFYQLDDPVLSQIRDEILTLDVNNLTPIEALNKLNDIKRILKGK